MTLCQKLTIVAAVVLAVPVVGAVVAVGLGWWAMTGDVDDGDEEGGL